MQEPITVKKSVIDHHISLELHSDSVGVDLIPFIQQQQQKIIKDQIKRNNLSDIFDGTKHVCAACYSPTVS